MITQDWAVFYVISGTVSY